MGLPAARSGDRRGEEILQFEHAARGGDIFVGGNAAHRRFMHLDREGDGLEVERPQMFHAVCQKSVLLAHDFARNFEDRARTLIQRFDQP